MRVAVIPARGGSKRIPRKNIRDFAGKPALTSVVLAPNGSLWVKVVSPGDPGTGAPGGGASVLVSR